MNAIDTEDAMRGMEIPAHAQPWYRLLEARWWRLYWDLWFAKRNAETKAYE